MFSLKKILDFFDNVALDFQLESVLSTPLSPLIFWGAQVNFSGPWENVYALWQHL